MTLGDAFTCILGHKTQVIKTLSIHYIGQFFHFLHCLYKVHETPLIYLLPILHKIIKTCSVRNDQWQKT